MSTKYKIIFVSLFLSLGIMCFGVGVWLGASWFGGMFVHDYAFQELISSGRLNLIENEGLRESIARYYKNIGTVEETRLVLPREITERITQLTGNSPYVYLEDRSLLTQDDKARLVAEIRNTPELVKELRRLHAITRLFTDRINDSLAENEALREMLRAQL